MAIFLLSLDIFKTIHFIVWSYCNLAKLMFDATAVGAWITWVAIIEFFLLSLSALWDIIRRVCAAHYLVDVAEWLLPLLEESTTVLIHILRNSRAWNTNGEWGWLAAWSFMYITSWAHYLPLFLISLQPAFMHLLVMLEQSWTLKDVKGKNFGLLWSQFFVHCLHMIESLVISV